jgi:hypothetical protein
MRRLSVPCSLFLVPCSLFTACGGASPPPASPDPPPQEDLLAGCWRDPDQGLTLCLEPAGYVLFLPNGNWDRVVVEWAEQTPERRSGRTRTPRPYWLSLEKRGARLAMKDGESETLLERPAEPEWLELERRIAALPSLAEVCDRAELCRRAAAAVLGRDLPESGSELEGTRACIAFMNVIAGVFREAGQPVPGACGGSGQPGPAK